VALSKGDLRRLVRENLDIIISQVNAALRGEGLHILERVLARLGRGSQLPHWYELLRTDRCLPNLDGKTIGSVVEMILVAVLETATFAGVQIPPLRINPARGVDLPDLDLGVKSPSENFCTSEPYFSAYERLLGSEHDALVLLTDYQEAKKSPPLKLQIIDGKYLTRTQIADENLCRTAKKHRGWLLGQNEAWARKVFRFLAYVNQSDWRAKRILKLLDIMLDEGAVKLEVKKSEADFAAVNKRNVKRGRLLLPISELEAITSVLNVTPKVLGVIDAADNWVTEVIKDAARAPNGNEWQRFLTSPLDGAIGMSLALQWRYNFGRLFGAASGSDGEGESG
jgi:hypothetical protein